MDELKIVKLAELRHFPSLPGLLTGSGMGMGMIKKGSMEKRKRGL